MYDEKIVEHILRIRINISGSFSDREKNHLVSVCFFNYVLEKNMAKPDSQVTRSAPQYKLYFFRVRYMEVITQHYAGVEIPGNYSTTTKSRRFLELRSILI